MSWTFNPFTGCLDYYLSVSELEETLSHSDLDDMPDVLGTNTDHDTRYLTLDCSNDPLTGDLDLGTHSLTTTGTVICGIVQTSNWYNSTGTESFVWDGGGSQWYTDEKITSASTIQGLDLTATNLVFGDTGRFDSGVYAGTPAAPSTLPIYVHDGAAGTVAFTLNGATDTAYFTDVSGDTITFAGGSITSSTGEISLMTKTSLPQAQVISGRIRDWLNLPYL